MQILTEREVSTSTEFAMNDHFNDKHSFQDACGLKNNS